MQCPTCGGPMRPDTLEIRGQPRPAFECDQCGAILATRRAGALSPMRIEVLGVYRIPVTPELVRRRAAAEFGETEITPEFEREIETLLREELAATVLIEIRVTDPDVRFHPGNFGQPRGDFTARDIAFLTPDGADVLPSDEMPEDEIRFVFILDAYDPSKPLRTPFGDRPCPPISELPQRLSELPQNVPVV